MICNLFKASWIVTQYSYNIKYLKHLLDKNA